MWNNRLPHTGRCRQARQPAGSRLWFGCPGPPRPLTAGSVPRNTMEALPACLLQDVAQEARDAAVIGIDEGQFVSCPPWPRPSREACWGRGGARAGRSLQAGAPALRGHQRHAWGEVPRSVLPEEGPARAVRVEGDAGRWRAFPAAPGSCRWLGAGRSLLPSPCTFQFPDIVDFCDSMANTGKTVIVAALDGTFQREVRRQAWALGGTRGRRRPGRHRCARRPGEPPV